MQKTSPGGPLRSLAYRRTQRPIQPGFEVCWPAATPRPLVRMLPWEHPGLGIQTTNSGDTTLAPERGIGQLVELVRWADFHRHAVDALGRQHE